MTGNPETFLARCNMILRSVKINEARHPLNDLKIGDRVTCTGQLGTHLECPFIRVCDMQAIVTTEGSAIYMTPIHPGNMVKV